MNFHVPLNSCPISCPWINWTSVLMGLKRSSYLENFQQVIMKFFSLLSFFHFLWNSILIYFSGIKVVSNFCEAQLNFFPQSFHFYFNICLSFSRSFEGLRWLELWSSHIWGLLKNISCYIGLLVVMQSHSCSSLRKYFILFLICIFLGYRILSQLYFSAF